MPTDPEARKRVPLASGVFDYFPDALVAVAEVSWHGNNQHNPGQPLHWARGKSMDESDTALRHLMERGGRDSDGMRHTAKAAWRVLALLQKEIEAELALATDPKPADVPVADACICEADGHQQGHNFGCPVRQPINPLCDVIPNGVIGWQCYMPLGHEGLHFWSKVPK